MRVKLGDPDLILKGDLIFGYVVYIFIQRHTVIYVGRSYRGIRRAVAYTSSSSKADKRHLEAQRLADTIWIYAVKNKTACDRLEIKLIKKFSPLFNKQWNRERRYKKR